MGEPASSSLSVGDRMLVSLYNAVNDQPNVVTEDRVENTNTFIRDERPLFTPADREYARAHGFFRSGFPSDLGHPVAHRILLETLTRRLEGLGYTVNSVNSSGYGYQFNLSINNRTVTAMLYPAETDDRDGASFYTRLQDTAEVLQSPAAASVTSADIESHVHSVTFRLADGGYIFLDDHYLTPTGFRNGSRVYQALRTYGRYGYFNSWSEPGRPAFTGSVDIDQNGTVSASYAYPGHGDMPHVPLGNAARLRDAATIRARYRKEVDARINE